MKSRSPLSSPIFRGLLVLMLGLVGLDLSCDSTPTLEPTRHPNPTDTAAAAMPVITGFVATAVVGGGGGSAAPAPATPDPLADAGNRPGVADQFSSGGTPFILSCTHTLKASQTLALADREMPVRLRMCFEGFARGTLQAQITRPDGRVRPAQPQSVTVADDLAQWSYILPAEDPPGKYTIKASQGARSAVATFQLKAPSGPALMIEPEEPRRGQELWLYGAGFPANAQVALDFYESRDCVVKNPGDASQVCYFYLRSYRGKSNSQGSGTFTVKLSDKVNRYAFRVVNPDGKIGQLGFNLKP